MILVTVGTHEQPFDRLLREVDELVRSGRISEPVVVQYGYSTYLPSQCDTFQFLSIDQLNYYLGQARMVITHAGPSSFMEVLKLGKTPIVVPRQLEFGEHLNNHQVDFARAVEKRIGGILPVYDIAKLSETVAHFEKLSAGVSAHFSSNTANFVRGLERLAGELVADHA
ncbi:multidrug MFS transporter [Bombiscardovia apis]|uniref:Multidrug MFS transporter n=1 Tax=Bombiscardovia apis TaxID=2932182 RepID=A0ABM8BBS5_9BIFI|nr:glycosyltransferase [Bombiscardovia apis]BDR54289.1 multidrug MFS transporter [Bombiscardovia apis]